MGTILQPGDLLGLPPTYANTLIAELEGEVFALAPCVETIDNTDPRLARVKARLVRIAMRWAAQGYGGIRSQSVGGHSVTYDDTTLPAGTLSAADRAWLRAVCNLPALNHGGPRGNFPPAEGYDRYFIRPPRSHQ